MVTVLLNGGESSLNEELAAQLPSGDNVFARAFGDYTTFKTNKGHVKVTFLFDPSRPFSHSNKMASVTSDYLAEMRRELMEQLIDKELIAPRKKTMKETIWDMYASRVPKETLAKRVFTDDAKLVEFMDLLKKTATDTYVESEALTKAVTETAFQFTYDIAIDAYPQKKLGQKNKLSASQRTGVLTFWVEGVLNDPAMSPPPSSPVEVGSSNSTAVVKKRKRGGGGDESMETEAYNKLLQQLGKEDPRKRPLQGLKKFPLTVERFFDHVGRWFSTVVSAVQSNNEAASKNKSHMYH